MAALFDPIKAHEYPPPKRSQRSVVIYCSLEKPWSWDERGETGTFGRLGMNDEQPPVSLPT